MNHMRISGTEHAETLPENTAASGVYLLPGKTLIEGQIEDTFLRSMASQPTNIWWNIR